jgi:hypothetical protein
MQRRLSAIIIIIIIIIISGSTALAWTLAASHRRFPNLIKKLGNTPLNGETISTPAKYYPNTLSNLKAVRQTGRPGDALHDESIL